MSSPSNVSPAAAYLTKGNIVHPASEYGTQGVLFVDALEAKARVDIADHLGGGTAITVTGGAIGRSRG